MMDRRKVFFYRVTGEKKYTGLAMDCQMHQRKGEDWKELWFFDTIHPHMIEGEIVKETEDGFTFRSDGVYPGDWTFKVVTIEEFRRWIFKHVGMGEVISAKIQTTQDLHEWYRKTFHFPQEE